MAEKICESCAGKYEDTLPECPYCGSVNYKGAEAQYFNQLKEVREELEDLKEVPVEETKQEFRKQGRFLGKVFLVTVIVFVLLIILYFLLQADWGFHRDSKADYLWKQQNYPLLDELYEKGDYEALREYFTEENDYPIGEWSHSDFYYLYVKSTELLELYHWEKEWGELEPFDYVIILHDEWEVLYSQESRMLDEQENERLAEYQQVVQESFDTRWEMSETDFEEISRQVEENYGWISLEICETYVEKWLNSK